MPAPPWWQTAVIYQVYPRSFQDSDGDGVGDLPGVTARLDYLADLGVDAVWLSPFYRSPQADFGYDVADFCDVDPLFGTLGDFDRLVAAARDRGLKIIVDFVPNHTSEQHPWFAASRSGRDDPKRDWYVWRDAAPDGGPPNNWLSVFGGGAWEWDAATEQYYLHSFLREQPDLDWRNPEVKAAMFEVYRFWMARGVDGFRIDTAHFIMKDPAFRDNPPASSRDQHKDLGDYDTQEHLHDKGHEDIHPLHRELRRLVDGFDATERVLIGEIHDFDLAKWTRYYGEDIDELHLPFNFGLLNTPWEARALRAAVDGLEAALLDGAWPNYVLGNHDERRLVSRIGAAQARVAAVLLLTLRGTPTLYYGDELGMPEVDVPADRRQDPWGFRSRPELGRDGCRTPMAWDASPNAGFSDANTLWLPLHPDHERLNVATERDDPGSSLNLYLRLLRLRRATPALHAGAYRPLGGSPAAVFAFERSHGDDRVIVALNVSGEPQRVALPMPGRVLLSTAQERDGERVGEALALGPNEAVVLETT